MSLLFWRAKCIPVQPPGHGGSHGSLVKKRRTLNPEHPRAATSDLVQVSTQPDLFPTQKNPWAKKTNLSLFSNWSLFRASTGFRHLTRKWVPKRYFFFFFSSQIKSYILNRLEGFDCSSWAATGTEVNIEAFFQHTVIVSGFPFVAQEPTARIMEQKKISYSSCLFTTFFPKT